MTFDMNISLGNMVTIVAMLSFFFNLKFNQDKMLPVIFSKTGEVRLISFDAHKEMQSNCRENLSKDAGYARADTIRIEHMIIALSNEQKIANAKLDGLTVCLTALKYGADGKDLDKC